MAAIVYAESCVAVLRYFGLATDGFGLKFSRGRVASSPVKPVMHLPHFLSVKKIRDEKVLAQARELALLRLEQCIADLRIPAVSKRNGIRPSVDSATAKTLRLPLRPLRESSDSECTFTPVFKGGSVATAIEEIINSLRASSGRLMRVTFSDGVVQTVVIDTVDNAGFLHHGTDRADPQVFWTRFEDVNALEAAN